MAKNRGFALLLCLCANHAVSVSADDQASLRGDWRPLYGFEIKEALSSRTLRYGEITQDFYASGRTFYNAGTPSWGYWRVQGDRYCSQWPPQTEWACYELSLHADGRRLRFTGAGGDVSEGVYSDKP